ncbi:MAG TPA: AI-2E family transporter [Bacteroidales bacterium]|jgi:predicted PurR-regulated permease PerM|nr:AI-2E family transporter [Bacteroidales bacterium]HNZ43285.1 AI-2E family transporter [Bacteroidales bacterium]HOH83892.1 AI-2E family transporter [Bacteroidales bacterium]HPB25153.1 AI-2E family transporter [Bacteroidales bacterium]HPI31102.1 AI-2E family transporter [Bacteroidales bacterium]
MLKRNKWLLIILGVLIIGFLIWYFWKIVVYILVAAVLSVMGKPLVVLFDRIRIGKKKFPHALSALLTLFALYGVIFGFFALVVPMLISQITTLSSVGSDELLLGLQEPINWLENFFVRFQIMKPGDSIEALVSAKLMSFISFANAGDLAGTLISFAGGFFVAVFAIGFITFFFLKQERMLIKFIMLLTPVHLQTEIKHVYLKIIKLLSKYFLGLTLDLVIVMTLITIGMTIFGYKNALMIGVFAGMMNVVPYVGPIIGCIIALVFASTGIIEAGGTLETVPLILEVCGSLMVINAIDAYVFQPYIYSNVVKAHPLEIFLVILIAGSTAGILGMVLAIPSYTVIRIIAKQFLIKYPVIKRLTQNI